MYCIELANRIVRGRGAGNLYGVSAHGRRGFRFWVLQPQRSERRARGVLCALRGVS